MVVDNKAKITYMRILKEDLIVFRFVPNEGEVPDYKAGQFIIIGTHVPSENKIIRRAYSIASHPENRKYIELIIRWVRQPLPGRLTTQLFNAKVGTEINWLKPGGAALLINDKLPNGEKDNRRIVCIGGGTGIAPFVSFARHLHAVGDKREIVVLHGASYVDELSYHELFTELENESRERGKEQWNFTYRSAVSRPQEWFNRSWTGQTGRVETFLRPRHDDDLSPLDELVGEKISPENTMFYICGWQGTIDGCLDFLGPKGFVTSKDKRDDGSYDISYESYG